MALNWRRPLILGVWRVTRNPVFRELARIESLQLSSPSRMRELQLQRLERLLRHAWENTEYYREVLDSCGAVRDGKIRLDRFYDVPFLTKDIIRSESERLRAQRLPSGRRAILNHTGGSTGEPLSFWQDSGYENVNSATKLYYFRMIGKDIGELEFKIWGSDRDLFEGTVGVRAKVWNLLYNRVAANCFKLSKEDIEKIIHDINLLRPRLVWAYVDGAYSVAEYAIRHRMKMHRPAAVLVGAATVYPHMVQTIEQAFGAPALNYYGSREMGAVACECPEKQGLHISEHSHVVETIDEGGSPVVGREGELALTSLTNLAMPFIRYRIGDYGTMGVSRCACGRASGLLGSVSGRHVERIKTRRGELISPQFFIRLIGVVVTDPRVKRLRVIQEDYTKLTIQLVLRAGGTLSDTDPFLEEARTKIRKVMGEDCTVSFEIVDDLARERSGKYLYVVSHVR
jgi:phenylacetate-CoA ligase